VRPCRWKLTSVPAEVLDQAAIRCAECGREVDEFTAIAEKWGYWSDGVGELVSFCPSALDATSHPTLVLPVHRSRSASRRQ
jgi:hypothetical protein